MSNPRLKRPKVRDAVDEACKLHGISIDQLFVSTFSVKGTGSKKYAKLAQARRKARWHVIAKLYDPKTAIRGGILSNGPVYGAKEIGRILEIDHSSVIYAVKKMGIHPNANA